MSYLYTGFQITEEYSRMGLTNVQNALERRTGSRDWKQCKISL